MPNNIPVHLTTGFLQKELHSFKKSCRANRIKNNRLVTDLKKAVNKVL